MKGKQKVKREPMITKRFEMPFMLNRNPDFFEKAAVTDYNLRVVDSKYHQRSVDLTVSGKEKDLHKFCVTFKCDWLEHED